MQVTLIGEFGVDGKVLVDWRPRPRHRHEDLRLQRVLRPARSICSGMSCWRRTTAPRRSCTYPTRTVSSRYARTTSRRHWSATRAPAPSLSAAATSSRPPTHPGQPASPQGRQLLQRDRRRRDLHHVVGRRSCPRPVVFGVDATGVGVLSVDTVADTAALRSEHFQGSAGAPRLAAITKAAATVSEHPARLDEVAVQSGPDRVRAAIESDRGGTTSPDSPWASAS